MSSGLSHRRRLSLGLAVALLTAGCSTSSMIPIATPSEFVPAPPVNSPKLPDGSVATPLSGVWAAIDVARLEAIFARAALLDSAVSAAVTV